MFFLQKAFDKLVMVVFVVTICVSDESVKADDGLSMWEEVWTEVTPGTAVFNNLLSLIMLCISMPTLSTDKSMISYLTDKITV